MRPILNLALLLPRAFALVVAIGCAGAALLAQGGRFSDRLDVLTHFALVWLAGSLIAGALGVLFERGLERRIVVGTAFAGFLLSLVLILPELSAGLSQTHASSTPGSTLKIVQFNVWEANPTPQAAAKWILDQDPDVVVMEEAFSPVGPIPRLLRARYPYATTCARGRACTVVIMSKRPPLGAGSFGTGPEPTPVAAMRLDGPGGPFTIMGAHLTWPYPAGFQQVQSRRLAAIAARAPKDRLIITGDFNSTPWSFSLRRQDRMLGIPRLKHGQPTWPASHVFHPRLPAPVAVLPIDQVYAGKGWRLVSLKRGPKLGSDHYPLVVTLAPAGP